MESIRNFRLINSEWTFPSLTFSCFSSTETVWFPKWVVSWFTKFVFNMTHLHPCFSIFVDLPVRLADKFLIIRFLTIFNIFSLDWLKSILIGGDKNGSANERVDVERENFSNLPDQTTLNWRCSKIHEYYHKENFKSAIREIFSVEKFLKNFLMKFNAIFLQKFLMKISSWNANKIKHRFV